MSDKSKFKMAAFLSMGLLFRSSINDVTLNGLSRKTLTIFSIRVKKHVHFRDSEYILFNILD